MLLTLLLAFCLLAATGSQQPLITTLPTSDIVLGIRPLTSQTLAEAIAAGQNGSPTNSLTDPITILTEVRARATKRPAADPRFAAYHDAPFRFLIISPYVTAMIAAAEAKRKYEPTPTLSADGLNADHVVISVRPGELLATADSIENVLIKRNGQIVRPLTQRITPMTISNALGASEASAQGDFRFDFGVFAPDAPITIVMIGARANLEFTFKPDELAQLK